MSLGQIDTYESGGRFTVRHSSTAPLVDTGEYVEVATPAGPLPAIVETVHARREASGAVITYECVLIASNRETPLLSCAVDPIAPTTLVGITGRKKATDIELGEVARRNDHVPVFISSDALIGTHTCFFGGSGSGKSTLLKLAVEELLLARSDLELVVLDPNSDFSQFLKPRSTSEINGPLSVCLPRQSADIAMRHTALAAIPVEFAPNPTLYLGRLSALDVLGSMRYQVSPAAELL
jgi:hypothetical protein